MDLNKAMVELYKQRSASKKKSINDDKAPAASKREAHYQASPTPPTSTTPNGKLTGEREQLPAPLRKRLKYEDAIASLEYKPKARFEDLHGLESVQRQMLKITSKFKRAIDGQTKKSAHPVLICGSRGLGKTSIVDAAANQANLALIPISLKTLVAQTRNEFKVTLNQIVHHSLSHSSAIVLIDDLELLNDKEDFRNLLQVAVEKLSVEDSRILIFCTTSTILDSSYRIRFRCKIQLKRPDCEARFKIMQSLRESNKNLMYLTDNCLRSLAIKTPSFTAPDIRDMIDFAEEESEGQPTLVDCEKAVEIVKHSVQQGTLLIGEKPSVTWEHIGGMSDVRRDFQEILLQVRRGDMDCKFAGIALYGPPGCGKTMIAKAMANEAGLNFISIKATQLVDKYLGETERNIRRVFSEAKEYEPCMIYFDEFDGLCGNRSNRDNLTSAIQTLLSEMDGFADRGKSITMVSTNRLEDIDPAMKRPGRLSEHIYIGPPGVEARREILEVVTSRLGVSLADDVNLDYWAGKTDKFTGADLDILVARAKRIAIRELDDLAMHMAPDLNAQVVSIHQQHLDQSFDKISSANVEIAGKLKHITI